MSIGVVYMRPIQVAYVRKVGGHREAGPDAWAAMHAWLADVRIRSKVSRGYGLARRNHRLVGNVTVQSCYDACVELPEDAVADPTRGVDLQTLPGGAFLRTRMREPMEQIGAVFSMLCGLEVPSRGLSLDMARPLLEIYVDNRPGAAAPYRIDLCVPVIPAANGNRRTA